MRKYLCDACGCEDTADVIRKFHVTPQIIIEEAAVKQTITVKLCQNCRKDIEKWYTNISSTTYDSRNKRFRDKTPLEMVREYENAFNSFTRYKKEQQKIV